MAKITTGPVVGEARGKAGDIVFNRNRGGNYARALRVPEPPVTTHNLLSATHLDTTPATPPARGSLITGQAVATLWKELALGANGWVLGSDGTDALWIPSPTPLKAVQTADVTVLGTAAESTLLLLAGSATIAANSAAIGTTYRIKIMGYQGVGNVTTQTITLKLYLGATLIHTSATVNQINVGPRVFHFHYELTFRTIGNPGTVKAQASGHTYSGTTTLALLDAITGSAAPVNIDTTADQLIDVRVLWGGTANANNKIVCTNATIERLAL